jgi:hypothetical protein
MARPVIDHSAAVVAARTWANQMMAWPKCSMAQRLMILQLLRASDAVLFPAEQYENLKTIRAEWRARQIARTSDARESFEWMIQQLETCLGVGKE